MAAVRADSCMAQDNPFHCFAQMFEQCVTDPSAGELYEESISTASSGARLEVESATWGFKDQVTDVTDELRGMVESDELNIPRTFSLKEKFGDPAKGKKKQLLLVLKVDGEIRDPLVLPEKRRRDYHIIA
mmetsp:Transcript_21428/g.59506  ORF Transcript_21428/g.59506 Transcript_21428/m.59506 type:complete len:130 (+) Transcript_21428:171-560(+)|eukprot:CAMPEP_0117664276 /NCGR_PEP_ID=MMETSP0804-20121206/9123_1 /TAXON_ID=1074897 /ORGANISM="Tetraselmis astigmatica, Strain CCMP880" /LENGTH=129 /DNA_ID=CAMNT_0005471477 /DNA_START=92 /DNA_END=481 /DNA_ORIENTATION=+